jgi:DNA-binding transcriptional MerR regulator
MEKALPVIPAKRYFTIGEVSELCGVKPYVLRYWEQEFTQLKPMKRRGNRRYYQHHEVLLIRRIRELLYDHGFTISGARNRLADSALALRGVAGLSATSVASAAATPEGPGDHPGNDLESQDLDNHESQPDAGSQQAVPTEASAVVLTTGPGTGADAASAAQAPMPRNDTSPLRTQERALLRAELLSIRELLTV